MSGPGDGEDDPPRRAVDLTQERDDLIHDGAEVRVEVSEDRLLHRREHARRDV
jgi:hypothetical protein